MNPPRSVKQPAAQCSPVALWIILCAGLNAAGWILSALGWLGGGGYLTVFGLGLPVLIWWWRRNRPSLAAGFRWSRVRRRFRRGMPLGFAIVAVLAIAGGVLHAPNNYDALAYRLPRVLHWLADGQWHWIHTDFQRLNTRGCGIEWVSAPLLLLGTTRLLFLINVVSILLLPGLTYSLLTQLGVRQRVAWYWMWILPSGYCFVLQAGSIGNDLFGAVLAIRERQHACARHPGIGNDLFGAVLAMAAIDYALRASRKQLCSAGWLSALAAALMTSGKGFNLLLLLPWGLAMLPATWVVLRRPFATALVGLVALLASMAPTAFLNAKYCGDWKGLKAEPVNLSTGAPLLHLGVNVILVPMQNLAPTFFPLSGAWNRTMNRIIPEATAKTLNAHFESDGAGFRLGEMQMEEATGLGFGVSLLLLTVFWRRPAWPHFSLDRPLYRLVQPANLVPLATLGVTLFFFSQSGLGCPSRYLAPSYVVLLAPVLRLTRARELVARRWWRGLAWMVFGLAALLLIATPARPLWPAQTVLRALGAGDDSTGWQRRVWTVYSVYGTRAAGFAPARKLLPPDLKVLGFVTIDDPETSLWEPFGSRRLVHVNQNDDAASLRQAGIEYVLVNDHMVVHFQNRTMAEWLERFDGEVVAGLDLSLRATRGPTHWTLVRIRQTPPNVTGRAD